MLKIKTTLRKHEKEHQTHFPQIGEVEKMGDLLPLAFLLILYNDHDDLFFAFWKNRERKGWKKREKVFFVLLHFLLACSLWALRHLPETKSSKHTLVMMLVYKKKNKLKLDLQIKWQKLLKFYPKGRRKDEWKKVRKEKWKRGEERTKRRSKKAGNKGKKRAANWRKKVANSEEEGWK